VIYTSEWIWLHFPKCGGSTIEYMLAESFKNRSDLHLDKIDSTNMIWHDTINERRNRDPSFEVQERKILCAIRRLPSWILSRIHYEAAREPHKVATRKMLEAGKFFENNGYLNHADATMRDYSDQGIDFWIRTENLVEDMSALFGPDLIVYDGKLNTNTFQYIEDLSFWFTSKQLKDLYSQNPIWAATEEKVYGSLIEL
jgi:hypothetical protein